MSKVKPIAVIILLLICASPGWADCAVLTPDEARYYAKWDMINLLFKFTILVVLLVVTAFIVSNLLRWAYGKIALALLAIGAIPVVLGFLFVEAMAGECGFGGIRAEYYLALLVFVVVFVHLPSTRFAEKKTGR